MQSLHWKFVLLPFFGLLLAVLPTCGAEQNARQAWTIALPKYPNQATFPGTLAFSPDGRTLAVVNGVGSDTSDVLLYDVVTRKLMARIKNAKSPLFLGKGERIVVTCQSRPAEGDWRAKIYSVPAARVLAFCPPQFFPNREDKKRKILIGTWKQHEDIFEWDLRSKAPKLWHSLPALPKGENRFQYWLLEDNSSLVELTGTFNDNSEVILQTLYFRNTTDGKVRLRLRKRAGNFVLFPTNTKELFAYLDGDDEIVKIRNGKTGRLRSSFPITFNVHTNRSTISPDGSLIAFYGWGDEVIRLWNTSSGKLWRTLKTAKGGAVRVAFSPNGRTLASSGGYSPGIIKLWRIK